MKKTRRKTQKREQRFFSLTTVLKSSAKFVLLFRRTFFIWCAVNFLFLYLFSLIPNGWTNSLSILWLVAYYIFWCIYIRYMQQHQPYFSLIRIFNGLIPVSKIMFFNVIIYRLIVVIPFIPLFMGLREKYLEFFENYMEIMKSYNALPSKASFYIFMLLISPYTLSRPYLAWISSLIGSNRSIIDAYKKTQGNYWNFVLCGLVMSALFFLSYYIDAICQINTMIVLGAVLPVYFNIVFIDIYKIFYKRRPKTKSSSR